MVFSFPWIVQGLEKVNLNYMGATALTKKETRFNLYSSQTGFDLADLNFFFFFFDAVILG